MRTFKIFTLGCKVNQYDSQSIRESFIRAGLEELKNGKAADIYLINTCTVTEKADSDSLYFIRRAYRENPRAKIIVTGCLAQLDKDKILQEQAVSLIVKNQDKTRLLNFFNEPTCISYFAEHTRAFLKVQDGCNNFCSYCKVPLVRGRSLSKPISNIAEEARAIAGNGFQEIVLTGICLGAYGKDLKPKLALTKVIEALENIPGLLRIRLSSIEAADVTDELIQKMKESKKLMPHLHIPIQSADNEILKKMNRNYTYEKYLNLMSKIKSFIPGIGITTDVIVGFPGENEENFKNTCRLLKEILPLRVHIFPFSQRQGTPAYKLPQRLKACVIKMRIAQLKKITDTCALSYKRQFLNKNLEVLIEERNKREPLFWQGYAPNYIKVMVKSDLDLRNQIVSAYLDNPAFICYTFHN